jgi:hypothetical protein
MTTHAPVPDGAPELLRYKCDLLRDAVSEASRATASGFLALLTLFSVFALVIYSDVLPESVTLPFLDLTLSRWHAAALGPPLLAVAALNFASARALLQMRIRRLLDHLRAYIGTPSAGSNDHTAISPEELVGAILYPSIHVVVDFLYVDNWRGFRKAIALLMLLWALLPLGIAHMAYIVASKFHWNYILTALYAIILLLTFYSFPHLMRLHKAEPYFDFEDH